MSLHVTTRSLPASLLGFVVFWVTWRALKFPGAVEPTGRAVEQDEIHAERLIAPRGSSTTRMPPSQPKRRDPQHLPHIPAISAYVEIVNQVDSGALKFQFDKEPGALKIDARDLLRRALSIARAMGADQTAGSAVRIIASLIGHSGSSAFRPTTTTAVSMSLTGSCFSSELAPGPSIMGVEDEAEQSTERPCCNERQVQAIGRTHLIHRPARDIIPPQGGARVSSYRM